ncbi:MAG: MCE family protein [Myxococcales bacterium]|nr:MAG: MCE family protein [Myxococcales bacterium]
MVSGFKRTLTFFVVFSLVCAFLLMLLYNTMRNAVPGDTREYTALFTHVSGLSKGDDVRVAGVRVGKVDDIEIVDTGAKVTFELSDDQPMLANTQMVMRYQNLLGQRYLSLVQGSKRGPLLPAGSTVPMSRTNPGFDLTELLNGFRPLLDVLEPDQVNQLATSVIEVLQGEGTTIESVLKQTAELTSYVANRDDVIGEVLNNLTPVLNDLAGQGDALRSTVKQLRTLMTGLAKDRKTIGNSISSLSNLITETSGFLQEVREPAAVNASLFRKVAEALDENKDLMSRTLVSFEQVFASLGRASSYKNSLNVYLCSLWLATPLGEINLNGQPGPFSEVCR